MAEEGHAFFRMWEDFDVFEDEEAFVFAGAVVVGEGDAEGVGFVDELQGVGFGGEGGDIGGVLRFDEEGALVRFIRKVLVCNTLCYFIRTLHIHAADLF